MDQIEPAIKVTREPASVDNRLVKLEMDIKILQADIAAMRKLLHLENPVALAA